MIVDGLSQRCISRCRHPLVTLGVLAVAAVWSASAAAATDHFSCYITKTTSGATRFVPVPGVTLVDAFRASTVEVKKPKFLCAPANKNGEDPTAPSHPDHLTDFQIKPGVKFTPALAQHVVDQFGSLTVDLKKAYSLQVPSAKSLSASPPPPSSPSVDHFQCYGIKVTSNTPKFVPVPGVTVEDQFGTRTVEVKKPRRLCAPVNKNNEAPAAPQHADHLMCYLVKQTSFPPFATSA